MSMLPFMYISVSCLLIFGSVNWRLPLHSILVKVGESFILLYCFRCDSFYTGILLSFTRLHIHSIPPEKYGCHETIVVLVGLWVLMYAWFGFTEYWIKSLYTFCGHGLSLNVKNWIVGCRKNQHQHCSLVTRKIKEKKT